MTDLAPSTATLRAQQLAFTAALLGAVPPPGLLRPTPAGAPAPLDVYRHAYAARLTEALADNQEVLRRAMGDDAFAALARAYLAAHPSQQPSIRWFGAHLASFMDHLLAEGDADGLVSHPALADLARMDWALRQAFDAADAPVLGVADLAAVPATDWPALRLVLHPAVHCLRLDWAVAPAWHAIQQAGEGEEPDLPAPEACAHTLLVWRQGLGTRWRTLADDEAALLATAARGEPLAALFAQQGDDPAPVADRLAQWLADGLVSTLA